MLQFLLENWLIILIIFIVLSLAVYFIVVFIKRPTSEKLSKVREWLLFAVTQAEKELGGGTGQIKLRYVYDMFLVKFPYVAKFITFEHFSKLVDEALEKFRVLLETNAKLKEYVEKESEKIE